MKLNRSRRRGKTARKGTPQYTVRGISPAIDQALRAAARRSGKSLNETALDALALGLGTQGAVLNRHPQLDELIGSWVEDPAFDEAIKQFDQVDGELWK